MPIIKTTFLLLLLSLSFTSKAQYNEAMCILLKQQMHEYRFNTSNKNYRSAARNYEKNCKNPTPVNNAAAFEKLEQQTQETAPVNSATAANPAVHSGAIPAEPEEVIAPVAEQTSELIEQPMPQMEPEVQQPEQTEMPAKVDRITISDAPKPQAEPASSPAVQEQVVEFETQSADAEIAVAEKPADPAPQAEPAPKSLPTPAPIPDPIPEPIPANNDGSSSSLLMPSLIVLLVLLVAGLVIVRIRQSKKADANSELEQSLLQAKALKAAAEAQAAAEKEADELKAATAAVLAEEQEHPHEDSYPLADETFTATETDNNDELSELMHFSAQRDKEEQESESSSEQADEEFANAHQFNDLELGYDEKNAIDADDDFLDEQRGLEQELKLASLASSYSIKEDAEPQAEEVEQDEPELEEPSYTASSSFGFDEYSTKEPVADDEPPITEPEPFEAAEIDELGQPEVEEPSFTSSSSFGFDEYTTKEPITEDEPSKDEVPEYDLSSLMGDDLSFADHFNEDEHTVTAPNPAEEHDDINDDDLAKALQALEQELQDEPASVNVEEPSQPAVETVDLSDELSNDDKLEETPEEKSEEADKEPEQQDDKPYNPFANLSLDPTWDPNSDEKPVIESKTKQPKSQALIDAEERAKQFKTDE